MRLLVTGGLPFASGIVGLAGDACRNPLDRATLYTSKVRLFEDHAIRSKPHQGIVTVRGTMFNQTRKPSTYHRKGSSYPGAQTGKIAADW